MPGIHFFGTQCLILSVVALGATYWERRRSAARAVAAANEGKGSSDISADAVELRKRYLLVYCLVMGADWLQGPYLYSLYREQHSLSEQLTALLFVTGFCSGGITAPLVGRFADERGRKLTCLLFCATYFVTCVCALFPWFPILFLGRCLGGLSTSILFSVFEAWLVSSSHALNLPSEELSAIFGTATLANGLVAAASGIFSNALVHLTGHYGSPFAASAALLVVAASLISRGWGENFGGQANAGGVRVASSLQRAWTAFVSDLPLMILALTSTCFEVSMYIFVFLWVPMIQSAADPNESLPFGVIFSAFMVSMIIGSLIYSSVVAANRDGRPRLLHAKMCGLLCIVAALGLAVAARVEDARWRFYCFCLFEACVGLYWPTLGTMRGEMIPEDIRATLTAAFRIPLNGLVAALLLSGATADRSSLLTSCVALLALGSISTSVVTVRRLMANDELLNAAPGNGKIEHAYELTPEEMDPSERT